MRAPQKANPARALAAALTATLAPARVEIVETRSTPWESATFSGARHHFTLHIQGAIAHDIISRFVVDVGEVEFDVGGHIVADITVPWHDIHDDGAQLIIEALTVETA